MKARSKKITRALTVLGVVIGLVVATVVGAGWWAHRQLTRPLELTQPRIFEIVPGEAATRILQRLTDEGLVRDAQLARMYLIYVLDDAPLKAGEYEFTGSTTTPSVLAKLIRGAVVTRRMTIPEGLTLEETASRIAELGFGEEELLLAAMRDPTLIQDLDPEAGDLEGYLFPDTYSFARSTPEEEIVATMVATFRERLAEAAPGGLQENSVLENVRDWVILASIVEKEAQLDAERPLISSVYTNRLRRGIGLYADPTIIFALKKAGTWDGDIRRRDLKLDSPYNTYVYPGLPPGPIGSPGLASLRAASAPEESPFLYFVSRNDGSHVFAKTLAEHNRNVYKWQKLYWRESRNEG